MSISLPEFTITSKQFITNGTQKIELTVHDGKLYIMSHENGSIIGGTLVLDPLPDSAIYGTEGLSSSDGVNFTLTLGEQDFSAWTQADTDALIAALKAETGAAQVNITIEEGSVKAVVDFVLAAGADQAAKDTLVAKIDTVPKLNAILAASPSATLQTAATQNNTTTAPVQQSVKVKPELLSTTVVGDNVVFDILGAYNAIQWKTGGSWVTLAAPFPTSLFGGLEGTQSIEFRLISPDSSLLGIPATLSVSFPAAGGGGGAGPAQPVLHFDFEQNITDSIGGLITFLHKTGQPAQYVDSGDAYLGHGALQWITNQSDGYQIYEPAFNGHQHNLTFPDNAYTVAMWLRLPAGGSDSQKQVKFQLRYGSYRMLVLTYAWSTTTLASGAQNSEKFMFNMGNFSDITVYTDQAVPDTDFMCLVFSIKKPEGLKLYKNGTLVHSEENADFNWDAFEQTWKGEIGNGNILIEVLEQGDGIAEIYDYRIYDYAFTPENAAGYANKEF